MHSSPVIYQVFMKMFIKYKTISIYKNENDFHFYIDLYCLLDTIPSIENRMYKTKQKDYLYKLLSDNKKRSLTVTQIKNLCVINGVNIGLTTIYRVLNELNKNNKLRSSVNNNKETEYQFLQNDCNKHFHAKCSDCGKLIHITCDTAEKLKNHMLKEHNFCINLIDTTISGKCNKCLKGSK